MAKPRFQPNHGNQEQEKPSENKPEVEATLPENKPEEPSENKPEEVKQPTEKIKVKTSKQGRFNSTINYQFGKVRFNENGVAEVTQEESELLLSTDKSIIVLNEDYKPVSELKKLSDANTTIERKEAEIRNLNNANIRLLNEIKTLKANIASKDQIIANFRQKEKDAEINDAKKLLLEKTPAQLRAICEKHELPIADWQGLGKYELVDYLYKLAQ